MKRFLSVVLPPLIVLLLLAFVVWRVAGEDRSAVEQERLKVHWGQNPSDPEMQLQALRRHQAFLVRHGHDIDDRWFAARSLLKSGVPAAAVDAIWDDPNLRRAPRSGRRLAGLILRTTGWVDDQEFEKPRGAHDTILPVLADGGDAMALDRLAARIEEEPWPRLATLFLAIQVEGGPTVRQAAADALRRRGDPEGERAAAILAAQKDPYAYREQDLETLRRFVSEPVVDEQRLLWSMACRALGRMEDPQGLATLEETRARLTATGDPLALQDAAMASIGLVAGGRWEAEKEAEAFLDPTRPRPEFADGYLDATIHRWQQQDPEALERLRRWWTTAVQRGPFSPRTRLAFGLFLRGGEVPAADGPLAFIEEDLARGGKNSVDAMLAAAVRLRRGERPARNDIVQTLRTLVVERGPLTDGELANPFFFHPLRQACRNLFLYDR